MTNRSALRALALCKSKGIRAGAIIDIEAASQAIGQAVERAEAMANVSISGVRVALPGAQMASHRVYAEVSLGTKPISDDDLNRAIAMGLSQVRFINRKTIHLLPVHGLSINKPACVDPRNMTGRVLGLELLVITIDENIFQNIVQMRQPRPFRRASDCLRALGFCGGSTRR